MKGGVWSRLPNPRPYHTRVGRRQVGPCLDGRRFDYQERPGGAQVGEGSGHNTRAGKQMLRGRSGEFNGNYKVALLNQRVVLSPKLYSLFSGPLR